MERSERVPDYVGHLVGYRTWEACDPGYLKSIAMDYIWTPKETLQALPCGGVVRLHAAPEMECNCGFYAFRDPTHPELDAHRQKVWGKVALWGKVIEHDDGWRAEWVKILELIFSPSFPAVSRMQIVDRYQVPWRMFDLEGYKRQQRELMLQREKERQERGVTGGPVMAPRRRQKGNRVGWKTYYEQRKAEIAEMREWKKQQNNNEGGSNG